MNIASQEDHDMPIPLNTTYVGGGGHGHMIHHPHDHHAADSAPPTHKNITTTQPPQRPLHANGHGNNNDDDHQDPYHVGYHAIIKKPMIKYKECLKNHAAAMGGNATDGCGEFMPSGEVGSIEALTCSVCNCHRNFHRKEVEGETPATAISSYHQPPPPRKLMVNHHNIRSAMPHQMIMPIGVSNYRYMHNLESDDFMEQEGVTPASRPPPYNQKKRFRTKFTPEQKEKMLSFAERVGWKIQRQEDSVVQRFCEEIGVKRRVLKVWMHNNKLHFSNKNTSNNINLDNDKINNVNNVDLSGNNDMI
ncbi:Zinc-finger homeodomain protein 4 [Raphanus sativus]|uniref:Zinc-finger homeodomain protein 4 n=1 Tax=Raphanus sativus TaxID=3726 RepID=A0A6J0JIL5_RAPSA|nr:zinc-finger homeodomain protein 4 [Raphanus sativus]XP_018435483.1 zinc-finger homeodomain protein 4 [Raphanus sativus]KAJ4915761.1 Zinc-finger homeodomain protein 4 [Raphanus sativus]